jgi:hypothetical protein
MYCLSCCSSCLCSAFCNDVYFVGGTLVMCSGGQFVRVDSVHNLEAEEFYLVDIRSYTLLKLNWYFRGTCRLNLQSRGVHQARNQREAGSRQIFSCCLLHAGFLQLYVNGESQGQLQSCQYLSVFLSPSNEWQVSFLKQVISASSHPFQFTVHKHLATSFDSTQLLWMMYL